MEFETEVHITENFSRWSEEDKAKLIAAIQAGDVWEFTGEDTVEVDGCDLADAAREARE